MQMHSRELLQTPQQRFPGLSTQEVAARRARGLNNVLPVKSSRSYVQIVRENIFTSINNILFVLALTLILLGQVSDAVVSVGVVLLNVVVSVLQEVRAKRMLDKIALLNRPTTTVVRDGQQLSIDPAEVVVGDVLLLHPGDQVVVDGPVLQTERLDVDEALLTGESDLVQKREGDTLYSGSFCVNGGALYQAEKVGTQSVAYGLTAGARAFRRIYTPLQRDINLVIRVMLLCALFFEVLLLVSSVVNEFPPVEAVKMAVVILSLVPNGLFLSIAVAYALGAVRIAGKGALVQQANSVESLSNVDVLCMDKTGTLTANVLKFERALPLGILENEFRHLLGNFVASGSTGNKTSAAIAAACPGRAKTVREEIPFSSAYKWSGLAITSAAAEATGDGYRGTASTMHGIYILGALEMLAPALRPGSDVQTLAQSEAVQGLRVLLFAYSPDLVPLRDANDKPILPHDLIPLGIVSLSDELRPEARETLAKFSASGIQPKVISGDDPQTVAALARQTGLGDDIEAVSGLDLAEMDSAQFATTAESATIFGRITPQQKEMLIDALRKQGHYVAMIGDGINDVLSLKKANLGIAMQSGSQATRSVADIVLLKDSFASLPEAFREGQRIRNGMQDILKLYLTRVLCEVLLITGTAVVGGFPFAPKQLSVLVLLTVGVPSFFLAAWAPAGNTSRNTLPAMWHFVIPAMTTLGLLGLFIYLGEYTYIYFQTLALPHSTEAVADAVATPYGQSALTTFAMICGILLILCVAPPSPFWVGGAVLRRDQRIILLALAMFLGCLILHVTPALRNLFDLRLLGPIEYLAIAIVTLLWLLLTQVIWRGKLLEKFLSLQ